MVAKVSAKTRKIRPIRFLDEEWALVERAAALTAVGEAHPSTYAREAAIKQARADIRRAGKKL